MTWVYVVCLATLALAVVVAVTRVEQGPSMLDRAVAIDVITAGLMGFVAITAAMTGRTDLIAIMAALALVGFISTVAVARFAGAESDEERRILTREELEALLRDEPQLRDEDAPVHDVDQTAIPAPDDGTGVAADEATGVAADEGGGR